MCCFCFCTQKQNFGFLLRQLATNLVAIVCVCVCAEFSQFRILILSLHSNLLDNLPPPPKTEWAISYSLLSTFGLLATSSECALLEPCSTSFSSPSYPFLKEESTSAHKQARKLYCLYCPGLYIPVRAARTCSILFLFFTI